MALQSFRVVDVKAVSLAECTSVPKIMVIAGPNGVGKSTVLYQISRRSGIKFDSNETTVLYQPPHRAVRATTVRRRFTFGGAMRWFSDVLSAPEVSGFEGLNFPLPGRTPDNVDEAGSTIKYSLGRLENRYQSALAQRVQRDKASGTVAHLAYADVPDIYEPLRNFTDFLLPHLRFNRVDFQDEDNIKCYWTRKDRSGEALLDIDQLSSGEKSLVTLFLPLLESEISALLNKIDPTEGPKFAADTLMIIDEPEQHIHPDLQARVMTYMRRASTRRGIQFIVSTHSPTILDQAWDDELYVLTPRGEVSGENQLKKVASNLERLEALRDLTGGDTFVVTTGRSIVCVEGRRTSHAPSDLRLLELMFPRATAFTFVPVGNKANVINTVADLRASLPKEIFKIEVYGITDRDRGDAVPPGVFSWPVCMIENFLVDPSLVSEAATQLGAEGDWSAEATTQRVERLAQEQRADEIGLRVSKALGAKTVRPKGDSAEAVARGLQEQMEPFEQLLDDPEKLRAVVATATEEVDRILREGRALREFRGKQLLGAVFNEAFSAGQVSYSQFVHRLAMLAESHQLVQDDLNRLFDELVRSVNS